MDNLSHGWWNQAVAKAAMPTRSALHVAVYPFGDSTDDRQPGWVPSHEREDAVGRGPVGGRGPITLNGGERSARTPRGQAWGAGGIGIDGAWTGFREFFGVKHDQVAV